MGIDVNEARAEVERVAGKKLKITVGIAVLACLASFVLGAFLF